MGFLIDELPLAPAQIPAANAKTFLTIISEINIPSEALLNPLQIFTLDAFRDENSVTPKLIKVYTIICDKFPHLQNCFRQLFVTFYTFTASVFKLE